MILTTHSMEEADVLCNRIGIFKDGGLKCIGPQTRLKKLYGDGYYLNINCFRDMESYMNSKQRIEEGSSLISGRERVNLHDASLGTNVQTENSQVNFMADIEEMEPYYEKLKSFIKEILPKSELRTAFNGNFFFQVSF
jgi:ABC-type multidrug transport system ATPase subunit